MKYPEKLTLENLMPSEKDILLLKSMSKGQRTALYNLCTILFLTFYEEDKRAAAQALREIIRKNTYDPKYNVCDFDLSTDEKKLLSNPVRTTKEKQS